MCPRDGTDPSTLIHRADLAVYRAKIQGRNRVVDGGPSRSATSCRTPSGAARAVALPSEQTAPPRRTARAGGRRRPAAHRPPPAVRGPRLVALSAAGRRRSWPWSSVAGILLTALGSSGRSTASSDRHRGAARARRARRRRPGARAPGRGGGRLGRCCRCARRRGADRTSARRSCSPSRPALVDWSARRPPIYTSIYNLGMLSLAGPRRGSACSPRAGVPMLGNSFRSSGWRRRGLLRRQHEPARLRDRARGARADAARLERATSPGSLPHYLAYGFVAARSSRSPTRRCTSTRSPSSSCRSC